MSIFKNMAIIICICLFIVGAGAIVSANLGLIVIDPSGEISFPFISISTATPTPRPIDIYDPVIGTYRSSDDTTVCRFYGNGTFIFKSLIHPSTSFGNWKNNRNGHYSLYLSSTETEGKVVFANPLLNPAMEYDLKNGGLASSSSDEYYGKISDNPDEAVQAHAYPTTSAQTPINRQVGVEVKRVSPSSIYVKVLSGKDIPSLVSIRVMANGRAAQLTSGKITPQVGSLAFYNVNENTDISVVAEFYDYTQYAVWTGKI